MANKNTRQTPEAVAEEPMKPKAKTAAEAVAEEPVEAKDETAAEAVAEEPVESKAKGKKPEAAEGASEIWCYIGPNLRGLIHTGKVFRGSKAEVLKRVEGVLEKAPEAQRLIVAGENLAQAKVTVKTPGSALYETFKALKEKEEKNV